MPIAAVGGFECGEIMGARLFFFGGKIDEREIEAAEQLGEKDADGASVEIPEWVNAEEAPLGKGEEFQGEVNVLARCSVPSSLNIQHVVAHEHGQMMRGGRGQRADGHFHGPPFSGPIGRQVAADAAVKLGDEAFIQWPGLELFGLHGLFQPRDTLPEEGS